MTSGQHISHQPDLLLVKKRYRNFPCLSGMSCSEISHHQYPFCFKSTIAFVMYKSIDFKVFVHNVLLDSLLSRREVESHKSIFYFVVEFDNQ